MRRPAVIVDTNVVVAGLLNKHDASPVARILDGMLGAAFPFVLPEALLAGYRAVLVRPTLRKLHGLTVDEVEAILTDLAQHTIVLAPVAAPPLLILATSCCGSCWRPRQTSCWSLATSRCFGMRACEDA